MTWSSSNSTCCHIRTCFRRFFSMLPPTSCRSIYKFCYALSFHIHFVIHRFMTCRPANQPNKQNQQNQNRINYSMESLESATFVIIFFFLLSCVVSHFKEKTILKNENFFEWLSLIAIKTINLLEYKDFICFLQPRQQQSKKLPYSCKYKSYCVVSLSNRMQSIKMDYHFVTKK